MQQEHLENRENFKDFQIIFTFCPVVYFFVIGVGNTTHKYDHAGK